MDNIFDKKINDMVDSIKNNQYIFEVTKCCNYSVFIPIYKDATLIELYNWISYHFQNKSIKLYVVNYQDEKLKIEIPKNTTTTIRNFILENKFYFSPIYPIPASVVYKIYLDDGFCHNEIDLLNNCCTIHS